MEGSVVALSLDESSGWEYGGGGVGSGGGGLWVETGNEVIQAKHVVWAAGEFQFPRLGGFGRWGRLLQLQHRMVE